MNLWRDGAPIFVADPPPFHPLSWLGVPEPLLVVAGIATIAVSTDRFLRDPRLARWLELTLVAALAALGLDPNLLAILLAVVTWRALRAGIDDRRLPPLLGALVVAALLSAFWWLPALEVSKWQPRPPSPEPFDHIPASVAGHVANDGWQLVTSNQPWWPGWRVYANGRRLPPVIVHGTKVGAFVPPGARDVRFRYRPGPFDQGLRLAALGLLLLATSPLWRRVRLRRAPPVPQLAIAALLVYAGVLVAYRGGTAGGADSSGYLNQSRLWRSGTLSVPLEIPRQLGLPPALFIPLGFVPGTEAGTMVPSYPAGLPLHLALFALVGGESAQSLVSPLAAACCILLLYLIARRLGVARDWSITAAAALALCPVTLFQAVQPMSDVLATFWTLAAVWCALRNRDRTVYALAAGAAFGIGVLVRPTQMLLLPAMLLLLGLRWRALVVFGIGGLPFAAVQMFVASHWYGSPFRSGYGPVITDLALANFPDRFVHYSYWLAALLTPLVFPLAFTGALAKWTEVRTRIALVLWFAAFFLFYCFYGPYETWWYTRFLLPAIPALLLLGAGYASARGARLARALPFVALLVVAGAQLALGRHFRVLDVGRGEAVYERAATSTRSHLPPGAIVLAMQHSGAFLYYTGITPLRYDYLDRGLFETVRATGKPLYALVGDFELEPLRLRTTGHWEPVERFGTSALYRHVSTP
ncbi:MAG TPA: glycosyltransferase family 39 protein [Thermoanaerobaculia bacterium]|jgi:hypothetical protein